jgi:dihydrofolate reductase
VGRSPQPDAEIRRLQDADRAVPWNGTLLQGEATAAIARLKDELDGDLITWGCGELTSTLLAAGLVDELLFWVHPALWGKGDRPFWENVRIRLEPLGSETFDSGVALLRYAPASG